MRHMFKYNKNHTSSFRAVNSRSVSFEVLLPSPLQSGPSGLTECAIHPWSILCVCCCSPLFLFHVDNVIDRGREFSLGQKEARNRIGSCLEFVPFLFWFFGDFWRNLWLKAVLGFYCEGSISIIFKKKKTFGKSQWELSLPSAAVTIWNTTKKRGMLFCG